MKRFLTLLTVLLLALVPSGVPSGLAGSTRVP